MMTYRRGLWHRIRHPLHQITQHPARDGAVYCRTCYILHPERFPEIERVVG